MAGTTIRELLVAIGVDAGDADKNVERLDDALDNLKDVMLGVVAVAATVTAAVVGVAVSAAEATSAIADGASRTAVSAQAYQELAYQAGQANASLQDMETALISQNRAAQEAIATGERQIQINDAVAISLYDSEGALLSQEQILYRAADAIAAAGSEAEALGIATKLYGDGGSKLLPILQGGSAGMAAMAAEAHALGLVMSDAAIATGEEFGNSLDTTLAIATALKNQIGLQLAPVLNDLLVRFRGWYAENKKLIDQKIEKWVQRVIDGIELLEAVVGRVDTFVRETLGGWEAVILGLTVATALFGAAWTAIGALRVWGAIAGVLTTIKLLVTSVGAAFGLTFVEFVAVLAAAAAQLTVVALLVDDLLTYLRGGDSIIGRVRQRMLELAQTDTVLGALVRLMIALTEAGTSAANMLQVVASASLAGLLADLNRVLDALLGFGPIRAVVDLLRAGLEGVADYGVRPLIALVDDLLGRLAQLAPGLIDGITEGVRGFAALTQITTGAITVDQAADPSFGGMMATGIGAEAAALGAAGSAAFAPSGAEATGSRGGGTSTRTSSATIQGNTYSISGAGLSKEEVMDVMRANEAERARAVSAALEGGEA